MTREETYALSVALLSWRCLVDTRYDVMGIRSGEYTEMANRHANTCGFHTHADATRFRRCFLEEREPQDN